MPGLVAAARWEMIVLIGGLMIVVVGKIFTGGINLSGLLTVSKDDPSFSPGRAQMLMATVLTAMYYLLQVIDKPAADSLPPLPGTLVGIVGASQAIYLGGKVQSLRDSLFGKRGRNNAR